MAIVVESRKNRGGIVAVVIWFVLIIVVAAGAYYVFFKKPELIPVSPPPGFEEAQKVSKIRLNPEEVLDNPKFKSLRSYITPSRATVFGKVNPFSSK
jgi:flagellar basal body-associated protein FliL